MSALLPAFLGIAGRRVVLVGAGRVALGKLHGLLAAGADVVVVAPEMVPEFALRPVRLVRRRFAPADLDGAWFVVAAATREVNREVAAAAEVRRIFVNAVDDPEAASAYGAAVIRRGGVTVAISTSGHAPALAALVRDALEALLPDDLSRWHELARQLRPAWRAAEVPIAARKPLLLEALRGLYP